jgi:murG: undecaprenyldiphospho-muramoylpentapeptide beta-N-acetylglucosaminyltransferase
MKRIILSGGGTGGHIYPAITIAREILKNRRSRDFIYRNSGWDGV